MKDKDKNLLIILLAFGFILYSILLFSLGCSKKEKNEIEKNEIPISKPCVRKYPNEANKEWDIICNKFPYFEAMIIEEDIWRALGKVGFICPSFLLPTTKEINLICKEYIFIESE